MTHDEFLKTTAGGTSLMPEQQREVQEHVAGCPECLRAHAKDDDSSFINPWWLAIAAVLFLALWAWREVGIRVARERLESERAEIASLTSEKDVLSTQKEKLLGQLAVISAPNVRIVSLSGREASSGASAKLYLDPAAHSAVLIVAGLANTGADKDYQVWFCGADATKPQSGAVFNVVDGRGIVGIEKLPADVKSVTVTLEKNGGAEKPGAAVLLAGAI